MCGDKKDVSNFKIRRASKDGLNPSCKECCNRNYSRRVYDFIPVLPGELWEDVSDWEGHYQISTMGRFKRLARTVKRKTGDFIISENITFGFDDEIGYKRACLSKDGKKTWKRIHELMGRAFLANPENKRTVNHKDTNKKNNVISNLEWATHGENNKHAYMMGVKTPRGKDKKKRKCIAY